MNELLGILVRKARSDPFFLGALLDEFARSEQLDDQALAGFLSCSPDALQQLCLCRAPRLEHPGCAEDVALLAEKFAVNEDALADAVLRGQVLLRFRTQTTPHGLLAAARDADPKKEE